MIKKIIAICILMGLIIFAIAQSFVKENEQTTLKSEQSIEGLKEGDQAPNFTLQTLAGETVSLENYKGKKVVLNFWATWCTPCRAEMPDLQKYYEQNKIGDYEILAINLDYRNDVQGFVDELQLTFPIVLDTKKDVQEAYEVLNLPYTYFIDESGVIVNRHLGQITYEQFEKILNAF